MITSRIRWYRGIRRVLRQFIEIYMDDGVTDRELKLKILVLHTYSGDSYNIPRYLVLCPNHPFTSYISPIYLNMYIGIATGYFLCAQTYTIGKTP